MNGREATVALQRAAEISKELLSIADSGDVRLTEQLDAERRQLLQAAKKSLQPLGVADRELLREIAEMNDRALGFMEHRLRRTARDIDMLRVGRSAVRAYASNGRHR
jgi:hypothetical protein